MSRILLHTLVFSPDSVSTAYLMTDLVAELVARGHTVVVLTTTPHYNLDPDRLEQQPLEKLWGNLVKKSTVGPADVYHVHLPMKGDRVAGRIWDYLWFHAVALMLGWTRGRFDIVMSPSPPLTMGIVGWLIALRSRAKAVYNVQEIYPDFAINQGLLKNRLIIHGMKLIERVVYRCSNAVVTISPWFTNVLRSRGVPDTKLETIPNFVNLDLYKPLRRDNEFAASNGLLDSFVVLYGGNIGLSQDWRSLLTAAKELSHLPIQFVLVGGGAQEGWLKREIERTGVRNVRLLGYVTREKMSEVNASCDVGTIPMRGSTTSDTFPSKIYTILACARPVIVSADEDSELSWVVREAGAGWVVPPDDAIAYTAAVKEAFESRAGLMEMGARGRDFVQKTFSKSVVGAQYDRLIRRLTEG